MRCVYEDTAEPGTFSISCATYDMFTVLFRRGMDLPDTCIDAYVGHPYYCETDRHTEAGLEREMGLPEGSFRWGCAERGVSSREERLEYTMLHILLHKDD